LVSPNGQIQLQIYATSNGAIAISIYYFVSNADINAAVNDWLVRNGYSSNVFPTINFEGATFKISRFDAERLTIIVEGEELDYSALLSTYMGLLAADESFEVTYTWGENDKRFTNKAEGVSVNPYISSSGVFYISIYPYNA